VKEIPYKTVMQRRNFIQPGSRSGQTAMLRFVSFFIIKLVKNHRAYYFSIIYYFTHVYLNKKKNKVLKKKNSFVVIIDSFIITVTPPLACSRLSDSGEEDKEKGTRKVGVAGERKRETEKGRELPHDLFSCLRFLNSADPTTLGAWNRLHHLPRETLPKPYSGLLNEIQTYHVS